MTNTSTTKTKKQVKQRDVEFKQLERLAHNQITNDRDLYKAAIALYKSYCDRICIKGVQSLGNGIQMDYTITLYDKVNVDNVIEPDDFGMVYFKRKKWYRCQLNWMIKKYMDGKKMDIWITPSMPNEQEDLFSFLD